MVLFPLLGALPRGPVDPIRPNGKIPDLACRCRFVHSLGLKTGVYTSPGPLTCAGFEGSWKHEDVGARQFAKWGFDILEYGGCSHGGVAEGKGEEGALSRKAPRHGVFVCRLQREEK